MLSVKRNVSPRLGLYCANPVFNHGCRLSGAAPLRASPRPSAGAAAAPRPSPAGVQGGISKPIPLETIQEPTRAEKSFAKNQESFPQINWEPLNPWKFKGLEVSGNRSRVLQSDKTIKAAPVEVETHNNDTARNRKWAPI